MTYPEGSFVYEDHETTALTACMSVPSEIRVKTLEEDIDNYAKKI